MLEFLKQNDERKYYKLVEMQREGRRKDSRIGRSWSRILLTLGGEGRRDSLTERSCCRILLTLGGV